MSETPGDTRSRRLNMIIPIQLSRLVEIHMDMTEADARLIGNTSTDLARELGSMFVLIKDSVNEFLRKEGQKDHDTHQA